MTTVQDSSPVCLLSLLLPILRVVVFEVGLLESLLGSEALLLSLHSVHGCEDIRLSRLGPWGLRPSAPNSPPADWGTGTATVGCRSLTSADAVALARSLNIPRLRKQSLQRVCVCPRMNSLETAWVLLDSEEVVALVPQYFGRKILCSGATDPGTCFGCEGLPFDT